MYNIFILTQESILIGSSATATYKLETRWEGFLFILLAMVMAIVIGLWIQRIVSKHKDDNVTSLRSYNPDFKRRHNWFLNAIDVDGCDVPVKAKTIGGGGGSGGGGGGGGFSGGGGRFGGGGASGGW